MDVDEVDLGPTVSERVHQRECSQVMRAAADVDCIDLTRLGSPAYEQHVAGGVVLDRFSHFRVVLRVPHQDQIHVVLPGCMQDIERDVTAGVPFDDVLDADVVLVEGVFDGPDVLQGSLTDQLAGRLFGSIPESIGEQFDGRVVLARGSEQSPRTVRQALVEWLAE